MLDKIKFMEILGEILFIGKSQNNFLTKSEITNYFEEMRLNPYHLEHVYQYLTENNIRIEDYTYSSPMDANEELNTRKESLEKNNSSKEEEPSYEKTYVHALSFKKPLSLEEEWKLLEKYSGGDVTIREILMEQYLQEVVLIAEKYKDKGVPLEDLIQEGNIGLLYGMDSLQGIENPHTCREHLRNQITHYIEQEIDARVAENDWERTVLAKTNLINEAAKYLAQDLGRTATLEELAEYAKLSEDEINAYMDLTINAIPIRKGEDK